MTVNKYWKRLEALAWNSYRLQALLIRGNRLGLTMGAHRIHEVTQFFFSLTGSGPRGPGWKPIVHSTVLHIQRVGHPVAPHLSANNLHPQEFAWVLVEVLGPCGPYRVRWLSADIGAREYKSDRLILSDSSRAVRFFVPRR